MKKSGWRFSHGGQIDRTQPISFSFNGKTYSGFAGDTLASALLANGIHLVGRSFKYHRPRGILTSGSEEPNALVTVGEGAYKTPNSKATEVELFSGLIAQGQHGWPSINFDIFAFLNLLSPVLPAGFFYKTFMGPTRHAWNFYERFIRAASGLGQSPVKSDSEHYQHRYAHYDVLVIGGGPAGVSAALAAARTGARTLIVDSDHLWGGSLLAEGTAGRRQVGGEHPLSWIEEAMQTYSMQPEAQSLLRTTAIAIYDHNLVALVERVADHLPYAERSDMPRQRLWFVRAKQIVLATGVVERPLVFSGNDKPGIMLAHAVRAYVNRWSVLPGRRAVLVTNNDSGYAAALDFLAVGGEVTAIADLRSEVTGPLPELVRRAGINIWAGYGVVGTQGYRRIKGARIARLTPDGTTRDPSTPLSLIPCDLLMVAGGWMPNISLFAQAKGRLRYDPASGSIAPGVVPKGIQVVGAANGVTRHYACLLQGNQAGQMAAEEAGFNSGSGTEINLPNVIEPAEEPMRSLWRIPARNRQKTFIDLQTDVTVGDIELALKEGYTSVEHIKRYTAQGLGTDQGRIGNLNAFKLIAESQDLPLSAIGTTTFRPPYIPIAFGALAGHEVGELFDSTRRSPLQTWQEKLGAVFEPVGQWHRPLYYPSPGESSHAAIQRECAAVREHVGIFDASTLGKIEVSGPDAAEFLNRVYSGKIASLGVGRCRYGLMLKDDGMIFDDGVVTRLSNNHFYLTTTTGNAAAVYEWLEEWAQTEWPDLRVYIAPVTDQWAVIAVAGPLSRQLLSLVSEGCSFQNADFPHMSMREVTVAGLPARLSRISFSGERAYEIAVPARWGMALWSDLMIAGEDYNLTPYGTEAMHVLRAEKGYIIVGQETDGFVSPFDVGLGGLVDLQKSDFIGKQGLSSFEAKRPDRLQLVGLLPEDTEIVIPEGSSLVSGPEQARSSAEGYVTSSYYSSALKRSFALALLSQGREKQGNRVVAVADNQEVFAKVVNPVFVDPEGSRLRD
ncbi:MAG: sarcosine oxidase subunit alpha family protein [Alphaproteobacteria bacterium]